MGQEVQVDSPCVCRADAEVTMVSEAAAGGESSTTALSDSTEADQF